MSEAKPYLDRLAETYLDKLMEEHPNNWSWWALDRLLCLYALWPAKPESWNNETAKEYFALRRWAYKMIEAGIASRQSTEAA